MLKTTLEQWRMFRAVAEYGGFNQAAEAIHKSPSSIHHAIQKLETSLNLKLFKIVGRKAQLTRAGELVLRRTSNLLDEAVKVEALSEMLSEGAETQLKIAVDQTFPPILIYQALEKVSQVFPLLRIELSETTLWGSSEVIEQAQVDLAISGFALHDRFNEELCRVEFMAVANPSHPLHQLDRELSLEDLKGHRQIVVRDSATKDKKDDGWQSSDQRWTVDNVKTSIQMITEGFGFAWLPEHAIASEIEHGKLKALPLAFNNKRTAQMYLILDDEDRLGLAAKAFVQELRMHCYQTKA